jgi:predicted nucleotidyltransferase
MTIDAFVTDQRDQVLRLAAIHGAGNVRVFGSAARGAIRVDSDIDFLVEFEDGRGLLDLAALIDDLRVLLGRNVDVAEPEGLHWSIREQVLQEAVPL